MLALALPLALTACIRDAANVDFGACAHADGTSQPGIGTCIAGPVALDFVEHEGRTWLIVANSDPYRNYADGSVLFVPFDGIDLARPVNLMSSITGAVAFSTDPFIGGFAKIAGDRLAVTDRFSRDGATADDLDSLLVLDIADPAAPTLWSDGSEVTVGLDPQAIIADPDADRLFVLNTGQGTLSALDTSTIPFIPVIGHEDASILAAGSADLDAPPAGFPAPAAGPSTAELGTLTITDESAVPEDEWTMTWIEGNFRLWAPNDDGLTRWSTGGLDYARGPASELAPSDALGAFSEVHDPFMGVIDGVLASFFTDRGDIRLAVWDDSAGDWDSSFAALPVLIGNTETWRERVGGPSVLAVGNLSAMFFEGRVDEFSPPLIGLATSDGGAFIAMDDPVVPLPAGFVGVGDPFVRDDALSGTFRMWMSLEDEAGRWSIGLAESDDAVTWGEPVEVLSGDADIAAPIVTWANGRYLLWATTHVDDVVTFVQAESYDGVRWTTPRPVLEGEVPWDDVDPPRLGLQADPSGSWLVSGENQTQNGFLARAGATNIPGSFGYALRVASGFELGTTPFGDDASQGVVPGSVAVIDGVDHLFVTTFDTDGKGRISIATRNGDDWTAGALDLITTDGAGVSDPVVFEDGGSWRMVYAEQDATGVLRLRMARSPDGLAWTVDAGEALATTPNGWDAIAQLPHAIERMDDGAVRLWYAGSNGSRFRIGSALLDGDKLVPEPGAEDAWRLGTGVAGEIDDSGVRDPMFVSDGTTDELWYSAFDGTRWRIAHASRAHGTTAWVRTVDAAGQAAAALNSFDRTFAAAGVYGPVAWPTSGGLEVLYAGFDGEGLTNRTITRVGRAAPTSLGRDGQLYAEMRPPTSGDRLFFRTRSDHSEGVGVIDLSTNVHGFATSGSSGSGLALDSERGLLYLTSKATNYITAIDIRDDSTSDESDNFLGIEAIISLGTVEGPRGLRDVEVDAERDLLYVSSVSPEAVFVLDRSQIVDDTDADLVPNTAVGVLPVERAVEDANDINYTGGLPTIGPGDMALSDDGYLFVPNFAEDAVSVFDTRLGVWGREVSTLANIGGNPWIVRLSPDGRYAVVANYTGDIDNEFVSSTLAIIDADPDSPTAFQVLTWLKNR